MFPISKLFCNDKFTDEGIYSNPWSQIQSLLLTWVVFQLVSNRKYRIDAVALVAVYLDLHFRTL